MEKNVYFIHILYTRNFFNTSETYLKSLDVQFKDIFYRHGFIAKICNKPIPDQSNLRKFQNLINEAILHPIALYIDVAKLMDSYYHPTGG